jgi:hypothetical protein
MQEKQIEEFAHTLLLTPFTRVHAHLKFELFVGTPQVLAERSRDGVAKW